jgi:site-specific DNA recombinase
MNSINDATVPNDCVIYTRVSSVKQLKEGDGLESQKRSCSEFAKSKGYSVIEVFTDTISGSKLDRPGMNAMLKQLKFMKAQNAGSTPVIIDDISRLARDVGTHRGLRGEIILAGGRLECPNIEFGEDSDSILVESLLASVSEHQRSKLSEQNRNRTIARMQNGFYTFPKPIGYRYEKQKRGGSILLRDEPIASIIAEGLESFASGRLQTQTEVKRFFETKADFPKDINGTDVRLQRVSDMLRSLVYSGYLEHEPWGGGLTKGNHEALISYETHLKIKERLAETGYGPARKDISKDFPLRGFLLCIDCGTPFTANWSKSRTGDHHPYYLCRDKACKLYGKSIRRANVHEHFETLLAKVEPSEDTVAVAKAMFADAWNKRHAEAQGETKQLRRRSKAIGRQIEAAIDQILIEDHEGIKRALKKKLVALESEKAICKEKAGNLSNVSENFDDVFELALRFLENPFKIWKNGDLAAKRTVLRLVFSRSISYCRENGVRTPEWTIPFKVLGFLEETECKMVTPIGFEPITCPLGGNRS